MSKATAAEVLERLQRARLDAGKGLAPVRVASEVPAPRAPRPTLTGVSPELADALLVPGVVEVVSRPGHGARSLCLSLLAEVRARALAERPSVAWLGVVLPEESPSLCAPAVEGLGLSLRHLVVARPPLDALPRIAVRVVSSGCFCGVLVDGGRLASTAGLVLACRRMGGSAGEAGATVFLLADERAQRREALPCAARVRVHARGEDVAVDVEHHREGVRGTLHTRRPVSPMERWWAEAAP